MSRHSKHRLSNFDLEIQSRLDQAKGQFSRESLDEREVCYAALRQFGNAASAREGLCEAGRWPWLDSPGRELRRALKYLIKTPRFALPALLMYVSSLVLPCSEVVAEQNTEIVIIGTVHEETENFRVQDLVGILKRVKPDAILFELPAEMMTPSYEFKEMTNSLEQEAVVEYVRSSGAKVRPYDIDGRNAFYRRTNYFEQQRQCNDELDAHINQKKMSPEAQKIVDALLAANTRHEAIATSDPMTFNSLQADAAIHERQWWVNQGIPEIVRLTPDLKGCGTFWDLSRAEWISRNNQMVANIKRYSREFQGRRLVVICGLSHRYYLRSHLYDWRDAPPAYTLKEYWQY